MSFSLIVLSCLFSPYSVAFPDTYSRNMFTFDIAINAIFFVDIIINFLKVYEDGHYRLVESRKVSD